MASDQRFPGFSDAQVKALENLFPARCLRPDEAVEDHLRYAGKVDLIARMRAAVVDASPSEDDSLVMTEEEVDAAMEEEAIHIAETQGGTPE